MTLIRRAGFGDILSLRQAMDRLFEESFVNPGTWQFGEGQLVPVDVYTTNHDVVVQAILPGVKPEEVDITVEGSTLSISGDTSSMIPAREGLLLQEIRRGRFIRTLTLPAGLEADKATATFEDGILTLRIPKAEQVKPRQIKITTGDGHVEPVAVTKK
ncbi:MAG: Hsp20/alpha crystallin family protein [Candidatus Limnocylindrales bacterium]|jgi:HSP20 family protein